MRTHATIKGRSRPASAPTAGALPFRTKRGVYSFIKTNALNPCPPLTEKFFERFLRKVFRMPYRPALVFGVTECCRRTYQMTAPLPLRFCPYRCDLSRDADAMRAALTTFPRGSAIPASVREDRFPRRRR